MSQRGRSGTSVHKAAGAVCNPSGGVESTSVTAPRSVEGSPTTPRMVLGCVAAAVDTLVYPEAEEVGLSAAVFKLEPVQQLAQGWETPLHFEPPTIGGPRGSFAMAPSLDSWSARAASPAYACWCYDTRPVGGGNSSFPVRTLPHSRHCPVYGCPKALKVSVPPTSQDHAASPMHQALTPVYADTAITGKPAHHAIVLTVDPEEATNASASRGDPTVTTSCSPPGTPRRQSMALGHGSTEPELLSEEAYASGRMSPLRGSPPHPTPGAAGGALGRKRPSGAQKTRTSLESTDAQTMRVGSESPTAASASFQCNTVESEKTPHTVGPLNGCFSRACGVVRSAGTRFQAVILNLLYLEEAQTDPPRYNFDSRVIPPVPLQLKHQRCLAITELPFLILWVYFTYWVVIVSMTAHRCTSTVWISAMIAGLLVGIGLNANAYKSVTVPRRRGSVRHHRHVRALLELHKYGEGIEKVEMVVDWGIVIRFFIIPFGVSSLSGLTNSARDQFLLVFPRDPVYLTVALLCPAVIVACLFTFRVLLLWYLRVRWSLAVLFLNGALVD